MTENDFRGKIILERSESVQVDWEFPLRFLNFDRDVKSDFAASIVC